MNNPTVSIIMGVYNSQNEKMLRRSIESILNQTFSDFEFIICDDGSSKTFVKEILREYEKKDSRVKVLFNEKNSGLAFTLNKCIRVAKGKYIARQDDDDYSLPERLDKQVSFLDNHPEVSIIGCNILLMNETAIWGGRAFPEKVKKENLLFGVPFQHPTNMMRIEMLNAIDGYSENKNTRRAEDYDLYFKAQYNNYSGYNLQEYLFVYYESLKNIKKQKFKYRIDEFRLRRYWFKLLKLFPKGIVYLIKPWISGITPAFIRIKNKEHRFGKSEKELSALCDLTELNKVLFMEKIK